MLLAAGASPLLLYLLYEFVTGAKGGNPIGLGLLFAATSFPAIILMAAGALAGLLSKDSEPK